MVDKAPPKYCTAFGGAGVQGEYIASPAQVKNRAKSETLAFSG